MDELIKMVSQKAGMSEQTSRTAVDTVMKYLKTKLPEPIASQLDTAAKGETVGGEASKGLGDLLGGKK